MVAERQELDDTADDAFRGWTFLVLDDNPAALTILRSMLLMLGIDAPREALDGQSAMDLVRENAFDCIITDVRMEPMSGPEFVRWVRHGNEAANTAVRILAISAYRNADELSALEAEGANGFLAKPVSVPQLRLALKAIADDPQNFVEIGAGPDTGPPRITRRKRPA